MPPEEIQQPIQEEKKPAIAWIVILVIVAVLIAAFALWYLVLRPVPNVSKPLSPEAIQNLTSGSGTEAVPLSPKAVEDLTAAGTGYQPLPEEAVKNLTAGSGR